jgi:ribosome-associated protein
MLLSRLKNRIGKDGVFHLTESGSRSQWKNRERAVERFSAILRDALKKKKKRIRTGPPSIAKETRLRSKNMRSGIKVSRRKPGTDMDAN